MPTTVNLKWQSTADDEEHTQVRLEADDDGNYWFVIANTADPAAPLARTWLEADQLWNLMSVIDRLLHDVIYPPDEPPY